MRNIIVIIAVVAALAVGGYYGYQHFNKPVADSGGVAEVVPEGAIAVVQMKDIQANLNKLTSTPIWNKLMSIDYEGIAMRTSKPGQEVPDFRALQRKIDEITSNEIFKKVFNRQATLVVYPMDLNLASLVDPTPADVMKRISDLSSSFVFVLKIPPEIQVAEFASRFNKNLGSNITKSEAEYNGHSIQLISFSDVNVQLGYVRKGDLVILGLGQKPAENAIDVMEGLKTSLAQDDNFYKTSATFLPDSAVSVYWDIENSMDIFLKELEAMRPLIEKQSLTSTGQAGVQQWSEIQRSIDEMKKNFSGFETLGYSFSLDGVAKTKMDVFYRQSALSPDMAQLYGNCNPSSNPTVNFVPRNALSYQWFTCFDLDYYWGQIQRELQNLPAEKVGDADMKIAQLESVLGMSVGEFIDAFGDDMGGYLTDIKTNGLFPTPLLTLFLEVGNKSAMDRLLSKLHESPMIMIQKEDYNGTEINFLAIQFGPDIQPAYAYVGDYLLVSISKNLLRESIDLNSKPAGSLGKTEAYRGAPFDLTGISNGVLFVKVNELTGKLKDVIRFANQWATAKQRKKMAFASGSEKRLEDAKAKVADLDAMIMKLDDDLWAQEAGLESNQTVIDALKKDIAAKRQELTAAKEEVESLEAIVAEHREAQPDPAEREYILNSLVFPVLDAFSTVRNLTSRSMMDKGHMQFTFSIDIGL